MGDQERLVDRGTAVKTANREEGELLELLRRTDAHLFLMVRFHYETGVWLVSLHDHTTGERVSLIGEGRTFAEAWRNRVPPGGQTLN